MSTNQSIPSFNPTPEIAEHLNICQDLFFIYVKPKFSEIYN